MPPKRVSTRSQTRKSQPTKKQKTEKPVVKASKKSIKKSKGSDSDESYQQENTKSKSKRNSSLKEKKKVVKKNYLKNYQLEDFNFKIGSHAIVKIEKNERSHKNEEEGAVDLYDQGFSVVQIQKIFTQGDENTYFQVQWYVTPKEVKFNSKFIGKDEIFFTDKVSVIDQSSFDTPCQVLSLEKYEEEERKNRKKPEKESIIPYFYSRAQWMDKIRKLEPDWKEWEPTYCVCKQPANPDRTYIQCIKCNDWFHLDCIGFDDKEENQLKKLPDYICDFCKKRQAKLDKKQITVGYLQRQTRSMGDESIIEPLQEKKKKLNSGEEKKVKQSSKQSKSEEEPNKESSENKKTDNGNIRGSRQSNRGTKQNKGKKQQSKKVDQSLKDTPEALESNTELQEQLSPRSPQIKQKKDKDISPPDQKKESEGKAGSQNEILVNKTKSKKREEETNENGQNNQ